MKTALGLARFSGIILMLAAGLYGTPRLVAAVDVSGLDGWVTVMYGVGKDPQGDSQAGAADTDIVGDANHGSFYVAFDDNGTPDNDNDDYMFFRLRIDNPSSLGLFQGVAVVGMDANLDGRIDVFMSVDARNNGQVIRLLDPGTGANISPSTTTTSPLPTGWLPNNGVYPMQHGVNYSSVAVTEDTDPHWGITPPDTPANDIGRDGKVDAFVSWAVPIADLAIVLAKPSPMDKNGNYGPRGPDGIPGFDKDTLVRYVSFTQTQTGPINGDLNGVGRTYDKNATFADLGSMTDPMSPSNPVSASDFVRINQPISGDGIINSSEDDALTVTGIASNNAWVNITVSDGTTTLEPLWTQANGTGNWTVTNWDVSSLNDGTLTFTAVLVTGDGSNTIVTGSTGATATAIHDTTPPTVAFDALAVNAAGKPTFTGTSNLSDGSYITVTIDHDNNAGTAQVTYQVVVIGGVWSLDTATAIPISGTLPAAGLTSFAKVTATATDSAGNTASATALNPPTVKTLTTNNTTPILTGTWTNIAGDVLTVTVSDATYTLNPAGNNWSLNLAVASPSSGSLTPLTGGADPGNPYSVTATVTRGLASATDTTSNELYITNAPIIEVGIDGDDEVTTSNPFPTFTGTSQNAGDFVIVRIDPGNDGNLSDAVTYSVTPDVFGNWTLDLSTASPISGSKPTGGYVGENGVRATDSTGSVFAYQTLTVVVPTIAITSIISEAITDANAIVSNSSGGEAWLNMTEAENVKISGTATDGFTVDLEICDPNGNKKIVTEIPVVAEEWSISGLDLLDTNLNNGLLTITATLHGTAITDQNTSVTLDTIAPFIYETTQSPIRSSSGSTIKGISDLAAGTVLTIDIYSNPDFTGLHHSISATVQANGSWSTLTTSNLSNNNTYYFRVTPPLNTADAAGNLVKKVEFTRLASNSIGNTTYVIDVKPLTGDNFITESEISPNLPIVGETSRTSSTVTVKVYQDNILLYTKTTTSGGTYTAGTNNWSLTLSTAEVQAMSNGVMPRS